MLSQSTLGIPWSSRKHLLDKTEFIAPMDIYPYAKEHLHTSNLWNIFLKHLSIKTLTSDISLHNLDKNYVVLGLLLMYIPMQKKTNNRNWMDLRYISIKCLGPGVEINRFLLLNIFLYLQYRSVFKYIFVTPPVLEILYMPIYKFHICLTMPI